jgi:hypothetical protein
MAHLTSLQTRDVKVTTSADRLSYTAVMGRDGARQQRLLMGDPAEIRGGPLEPASHRVDQQGKGRTTPDATGLAKRQYPQDYVIEREGGSTT